MFPYRDSCRKSIIRKKTYEAAKLSVEFEKWYGPHHISCLYGYRCAPVAQLVEHRAVVRAVVNPTAAGLRVFAITLAYGWTFNFSRI